MSAIDVLRITYLMVAVGEILFGFIFIMISPKKLASWFAGLASLGYALWSLCYFFIFSVKTAAAANPFLGAVFILVALILVLVRLGFASLGELKKAEYFEFVLPAIIALMCILHPFWTFRYALPVPVVRFDFAYFYGIAFSYLVMMGFILHGGYYLYQRIENPALKRKMKYTLLGVLTGGMTAWTADTFLFGSLGLPSISPIVCFLAMIVVSLAFIPDVYLKKGPKETKLRLNLENTVHLVLRVMVLASAVVIWTYSGVAQMQAKQPIYFVLSTFVGYSLLFYVLTIYLPHLFGRLHLILLVPDLIVITVMATNTGGGHSPFFLGYYVIAVLYTSYYGIRLGFAAAVLAALGASYSYVFGAGGEAGDLVLRLLFLMVVTVICGLLFGRKEKDRERIALLHQTAEEVAALFSFGKLVDLLGAKLENLFGLDKYCLVLLGEGGDKVNSRASAGLSEKVTERIARKVEEEASFWQVELADKKRSFELAAKREKEEPFAKFFGYSRLDEFLRISLPSTTEGGFSFACLPLVVKNRITGGLCLEEEILKTHTRQDVDMLITIVSQFAMAIQNVQLYERTQEMAIKDGLTGIYNHHHFYEVLEKEIERALRFRRSLSLAMMDIDDFKKYNDTYGHPQGDTALREVAELVASCLRDADMVARYGGEEFSIILIEADTKKTFQVCERIRKKVAKHRFLGKDGKRNHHLTISMGTAIFTDCASEKDQLVRQADDALYLAKRRGKNKVCAADSYKFSKGKAESQF